MCVLAVMRSVCMDDTGINRRNYKKPTDQPAIARLENGHISPSVDPINRILAPLDKRLAVVDA